MRVPIANDDGSNPTADVVQFAFPTPGTEPATFYNGSWQTISGIYHARCLVGPGGVVTLTPAFYDVYVKITDSPEVPVLLAGLMEVL